jgi:RNA polymerase sigma-70 factor, ECF subfamily
MTAAPELGMGEEPSKPNLRLVVSRPVDVPSDEELLSAHGRGDAFAFDELVRRYQHPVYRIAMRFAHDRDEAEDLAQRTFVRALGSVRRLKPGSSFRSWLFCIAANLARNHIRDRARMVFGLSLDAPALPEGSTIDERRRVLRVREAMAKLPRRQRQVMTLRVDGDLPFADVASSLGITENNAKVCYHLGVRRLKELLSGEDL